MRRYPVTLSEETQVYPRGALLLYRNLATPIRYTSTGVRANINFEDEPIECAILIKGSDGRYYSNTRGRFLSADGWVLAAGTGTFTPFELIDLDNIRAERWSRTDTQVDVVIDWYRLERTVVDRETTKTARTSPLPPNSRDRDGNSFIRYYLALIKRESSGWQKFLAYLVEASLL